MTKTILIYYESNCSSAPRLYKQLDALQDKFEILVASTKFNFDKYKYPNVTHIQLPKVDKLSIDFHLKYPLILRKLFSVFVRTYTYLHKKKIGTFNLPPHEYHYWSRHFYSHLQIIKKNKFDLVIGHHTNSLIICSKIKKIKKIPFIFNAHEFYSEQKSENPKWVRKGKVEVTYMLNKYLSNVDEIFSVGNNIGREYLKQYPVKLFTTIPNDKPYYDLRANPVSYPIQLIHHGVASKARKIEDLIQLMEYLPSDKYELNLMLKTPEIEYLNELKFLASKFNNIRFLDIVPMDSIIPFTNKFDIGVYMLHPLNFNHTNALPNKFFEFIQARLCICITPVAEMKSLIEQFKLGVTSDEFSPESLAKSILSLSKKNIMSFKNNTESASKSLSSNQTQDLIIKRVNHWMN